MHKSLNRFFFYTQFLHSIMMYFFAVISNDRLNIPAGKDVIQVEKEVSTHILVVSAHEQL